MQPMNGIYLDHNATTPLAPEVAAAMNDCAAAHFANPSSQHRLGRQARRALEDAREAIADLLGASLTGRRPDRLIFTSGGTEANNLAVFGLARDTHTATLRSAIEHPSITAAVDRLHKQGQVTDVIRATRDGVVDLDHLDSLIALSPAAVGLVTVMLANHETGAVQPLREVVERKRKHGFLVHTDAVQVVAKQPVRFADLGVDALSLAAHKFNGPRGIGALVLRHGGPDEMPRGPRMGL
jgi:cysteine desulfurase